MFFEGRNVPLFDFLDTLSLSFIYKNERRQRCHDQKNNSNSYLKTENIRFFATFVKNIETRIKLSSVINALKRAIVKKKHYFIELQSGVNKIPSVIIPWQIRMIKKVNSNSLFQTKRPPPALQEGT